MWVLIIMVLWSGNSYPAATSQNVQGFATEAECNLAGNIVKKDIKATGVGGYTSVSISCLFAPQLK